MLSCWGSRPAPHLVTGIRTEKGVSCSPEQLPVRSQNPDTPVPQALACGGDREGQNHVWLLSPTSHPCFCLTQPGQPGKPSMSRQPSGWSKPGQGKGGECLGKFDSTPAGLCVQSCYLSPFLPRIEAPTGRTHFHSSGLEV